VVRERKAFTAIELLIAIGIIVILAGMLLLGLKHMVGSTKNNSTQIGLQNARSMMAELETRDTLTNQLGGIYPTYSTTPIPAPELVTVDAYDSSTTIPQNNGRFLAPAVLRTQQVMAKLRAMPDNRQLLAKMAPERLLRPQAGGLAYGQYAPPTTPKLLTVSEQMPTPPEHGHPDAPILVDAWNNPIIFVPPAGLQVAFAYDGAKQYAVGEVVGAAGGPYFRNLRGSKGVTAVAGDDWEQMPPSFTGTVTSPDGRPFFASAGPDGNFQSPMDNLYSFEQ